MMSRHLLHKLFYVVVVLCLDASCLYAQVVDTLSIDTVKNKYLPTGIRVGIDAVPFAQSRLQDNFTGWEFEGDIDFYRYYLTLESGGSRRNLSSDSTSYANDGTYWRVGVDVNFLTTDPDRNVFFLGARYGRAQFAESMSVFTYDPIWGYLSDNFYHSGVRASWVELTAGLRVKIWKIFWLGYTGRLKFGLSTKGSSEMLSYDVPGFGRTDKETTWGFNYYVMLRLPLRKAPPPPVRKKR